MYKHVFAIIIMLFAFVGGPILVSAQQSVQDSTYNQVPASGNSSQTNGTTEDRGGIDWRWFLPLLAVPFFFLLKRDNKEEDRSNYRDQRYAGAKGGERKRNREEDDL